MSNYESEVHDVGSNLGNPHETASIILVLLVKKLKPMQVKYVIKIKESANGEFTPMN